MTFNLAVCAMVPGQFGLGNSETVVVTESGCERLTPQLELELELVQTR